MRVLGIRCHSDHVDYAVVDGATRANAHLVEQEKLKYPAHLARPEELAWLRREMEELARRMRPDAVGLASTPPGAQRVSVTRAESDGIVLEIFAALKCTVQKMLNPTLRAAFGAKNNAQLDSSLGSFPAMDGVASSRSEPVAVAIALLPES